MKYDPFDLWNPHSAIHHVKEQKVTNPEPKVSEKARELVRKLPLSLEYEGQNAEDAADVAGRLIQSELSELLEAGRDLQGITVAGPIAKQKLAKFAAILSTWEPK